MSHINFNALFIFYSAHGLLKPISGAVRYFIFFFIFRFIFPFFKFIGVIFALCILVLLFDLRYFGRFAADHILANAVRPAGREMPATSGAMLYRSGDIQIVGGMGRGLSCSLPWILDRLAFPTSSEWSPIGLRVRQACVYHDYCYRHGAATYGYTQADCDFALQVQAFRICKFIESERTLDAKDRASEGDCMRDARLVTLGVRIGGSDSFLTLDERSVPPFSDVGRNGSEKNASTFFEFDPYPARTSGYTVYRIADAPPCAAAIGGKAIYRFDIRPAGTIVSYSAGYREYVRYKTIPGDPRYLTSPPLVIHTGTGENAVDWFVWWQRESEDTTVGQFLAIAPKMASYAEGFCTSERGKIDANPNALMAQIGRDETLRDDPQIDQLQPADFGSVADHDLSLISLRNHSCRGEDKGNAPCFVHVSIKTNFGLPLVQEQEPLSINDRLSRKPNSVEKNRYRNFASLPFVLRGSAGLAAPTIAWTRREADYEAWTGRKASYQEDAILRRAAVDIGAGPGTRDDTAVSLGTVLLAGFSEADEPAFVLDRNNSAPILASLRSISTGVGTGSVIMPEWRLPPPDIDDRLTEIAPVDRVADGCVPGLGSEWLLRPPQVIARDGGSLVIFSKLKPFVSKDWVGKFQIATLFVRSDGTCPALAQPAPEILILSSEPPRRGGKQISAVEWAKEMFLTVSRGPMLVVDLDGDDILDVILPESGKENVPLLICTISTDERCIAKPGS